MDPVLISQINKYNPVRATTGACTQAEWDSIRSFVVETVLETSPDSSVAVQRLLTTTTAIALWAHHQGFELEPSTILSQPAIEHFVATLPGSQGTKRSTLRRIARDNGLNSPQDSREEYGKPDLKAPYSTDELRRLWQFANSVTNDYRSISLRALLTLGLGCGLARNGLRHIDASFVHSHREPCIYLDRETDLNSDPDTTTDLSSKTSSPTAGTSTTLEADHLFVRAGAYCTKVRLEYAEELLELIQLRPSGQLIGDRNSKNVTSSLARWVNERVDLPKLSGDRLRANWVCHHLAIGTSALDLLNWSGLASFGALDGYLPYVDRSQVPLAPQEEEVER